MEANELMIGNWVNVSFMDNSISKDRQIKPHDFKEWASFIYKPIILTPEWLDRFELHEPSKENLDECYHFTIGNGSLKAFITSDNEIKFHFGSGPLFSVPCKYVHQLQNIYFALTGNELK